MTRKRHTFSSGKNPFGADGGKILLNFPTTCKKVIIYNRDIPGFDNRCVAHSALEHQVHFCTGEVGGILTADKLHSSGKN